MGSTVLSLSIKVGGGGMWTGEGLTPVQELEIQSFSGLLVADVLLKGEESLHAHRVVLL